MNKKILAFGVAGALSLGLLGNSVFAKDSKAATPAKNVVIEQSMESKSDAALKEKIAAAKNSTAPTNQVQAPVESKTVLAFDYDNAKYELADLGGDNTIHLMNKSNDRLVVASYKYLPSKDAETAAKEHCAYVDTFDKGAAKQVNSDLEAKSSKVTCPGYELYFIEDGKGGTYQVFINLTAEPGTFNKAQKADFLKNIKILPLEGNENLMKDVKKRNGVG